MLLTSGGGGSRRPARAQGGRGELGRQTSSPALMFYIWFSYIFEILLKYIYVVVFFECYSLKYAAPLDCSGPARGCRPPPRPGIETDNILTSLTHSLAWR